jgi:hypothetical protein
MEVSELPTGTDDLPQGPYVARPKYASNLVLIYLDDPGYAERAQRGR